MKSCILRGVRTHNLKGIDVEVPFGKLTAVTGVSGSGKSSLVFDTIYAEGQRRFVDCLSTYARQFLERLDRPDADFIGHLEPPVSLAQAASVRNARSTVGTMSELSDALHLLFAHAGEAHCPGCGAPLARLSVERAVESILARAAAEKLCLTAPVGVARDREAAGGAATPVVPSLLQQGYTRVLIDGRLRDWPDEWVTEAPAKALAGEGGGLPVDFTIPDRFEVVVDRFAGRSAVSRSRIEESVRGAWEIGRGEAILYCIDADGESAREVARLREGTSCPNCGMPAEALRPQLFSPNTALGACPDCEGFGRTITIDPDKVVPDPRKCLREDAVVPFRMPSARPWRRRMLRAAVDEGIRADVPWRDMTEAERRWVFSGSPAARTGDRRFPGVLAFFRRLERKRYRMHVRIFLARFRGYVPCSSCAGTRLRPAARAVTIDGRSLPELQAMAVSDLRRFFDSLELPASRAARVAKVLEEIRSRLACLDDVGLGYLSLDRASRTLSGGETQRLRLAAAIGSSLTRTLYVLDEPTVGLHARDSARVRDVLRSITARGSSVLVVEHDPIVIEGSDHLIVLGPEGGEAGGHLLYQGPSPIFLGENRHFFRCDRPAGRLDPRAPALRLTGVRQHNVDIPSLSIPLGGIVVIAGVSGSGKSTLLEDVLYRNRLRWEGKAVEEVGRVASIEGFEAIEEALLVGQEPLGRSVRSSPVTFTGAFPRIRALLAATAGARERRLTARHFSFNVPGGRCETCKGLGTVLLEMHFLPDVEVACETCGGKRFRPDVLEVRHKGKNILGILEMTVDEAAL
ncbi:MAG: excinuclease ABC subunit UvrA, partial [Candidatus Eisenbacteria bacterium]|nr:excinuclease ABC subunit UvrA [Candidatus Eisenbacteria bacterium]